MLISSQIPRIVVIFCVAHGMQINRVLLSDSQILYHRVCFKLNIANSCKQWTAVPIYSIFRVFFDLIVEFMLWG